MTAAGPSAAGRAPAGPLAAGPRRAPAVEVDPYDVVGSVGSGRSRAVAVLLATRIAPGSRVLEIGAGLGEHAAVLAAHGHHVVAVERSPVRAARLRRLPGLTVIESDARLVDAGAGFDVVVCRNAFGSGEIGAWTEMLGRFPGWLRDGGVGYVDVFDPAWWGGVRRIGRDAGGRLRALRYDRADRCLVIAYRSPTGSWTARERVHCLRRPEVTELAAAAAGLVAVAGPTDPDRGTYVVELRRP